MIRDHYTNPHRALLQIFLWGLIPVFLLSGCEKQQRVREYSEPSRRTDPGPYTPGNPPSASPATPIRWTLPEGWVEIPSASRFRIATFAVGSGEQKATCSVIPLRGNAGGLEANLRRWLGQLRPDVADPSVPVRRLLRNRIQLQTRGGMPVTLFDFTPLTETPGGDSLLAAVVDSGDYSIFIKMTGPRDLLTGNFEKFKYLALSFRLIESEK